MNPNSASFFLAKPHRLQFNHRNPVMVRGSARRWVTFGPTVLVALLLGFAPWASRAAPYNWNSSSSAWTSPGNWTPPGPPGPLDDANFFGGGTSQVELNNGGAGNSVDTVMFNAAAPNYDLQDNYNFFTSFTDALAVGTTITQNGANTVTLASMLITCPTLTINGGGFNFIGTNVATFGTVNINGGVVCVTAWPPSSFSAGSWNVNGGMFKVSGLGVTSPSTASAVIGTVNVSGGTFVAGCSVGTANLYGNLIYGPGGSSDFELGVPNGVGNGNDLINVAGDLTLDGTINIVSVTGFGPGTYRLFNYSGAFEDNGVSLGAVPAGFVAQLDFSTPNQVNLVVASALQSYTLALLTGLSLIANQLDHGSNTLNEVLPDVPPGSVLYKYNNADHSWAVASYNAVSRTWNPDNLTLNPGEGAFFQSPTNVTLTFTGRPHVPVLPVTIPNGAAHLLSRQTNALGTYSTIVGNGVSGGAVVFKWNGSGYDQYFYDPDFFEWVDGGFNSAAEPTAAVGEAVWIAPAGGTPATLPPNPSVLYDGLLNLALGEASLNLQSGLLMVGNLGSSGQDGVSIAAGGAGAVGVGFEAAPGDSIPVGAVLTAQTAGTLNGTPNQTLHSFSVEKTATNLTLTADFSALGATVQSVQIFSNGVSVYHSETNATRMMVYLDGMPWYGSTWYFFAHPELFDITILGGMMASVPTGDGGTTTVQGDHIVFQALDSAHTPGGDLSAMSLTGSGLPEFAINGESVGAFGQMHSALGNATLNVTSNRLVVGNLGSSGQNGVSLALGSAASASVGFAPEPANPVATGAVLAGQARGTLNGTPNQPLQSIRFEQTATNVAVTADFTALGASAQNLQVLSNGVSVFNSGSQSTRMKVYVDGIEVFGSWWLWGLDIDHIDIYWGSHITNLYSFAIPGGGGTTTVQGNQLVFQALGSTNVAADGLSSFEITGSGLPSFTLASETVKAPVTKLTAKTIGGSLVVSWSGSGVLQESSDLIAWTDRPDVSSPYSAPLNLPKKFFRVRKP